MERECDNCKYRDVYYKAPPCDECNEYQNWESADAMTNADRIRTMTDEELAEELWAWNQVCCYKWTKDKILNWLKEEVKDE